MAGICSKPARRGVMEQSNVRRVGVGAPGNGEGERARAAADVRRIELPQYETIALMLQGGGALGAYQAGVYQGLDEAGIRPNWVAGISIGALNTAIIAGNAPEKRVEALRQFWATICQPYSALNFWPAEFESRLFEVSDAFRQAFAAWYSARALVEGQSGFF